MNGGYHEDKLSRFTAIDSIVTVAGIVMSMSYGEAADRRQIANTTGCLGGICRSYLGCVYSSPRKIYFLALSIPITPMRTSLLRVALSRIAYWSV